MKKLLITIAATLNVLPVLAHEGADHTHGALVADKKLPYVASAWGELKFRDATEYSLPADAALAGYLKKNHGGSDVDPVTSALYTTIGAKVIRFNTAAGAGVILDDDEKFGQGNFHGLAVVKGGEKPSIYFSDNSRHLVRHRDYADGKSFDLAPKADAVPYFDKAGKFNPTDVEIHPKTGNPWAFDGYGSSLVFDVQDQKEVFGGKKQFSTSHGGAFHKEKLVVCSRGSGEICTLSLKGEIEERFLVLKGTNPCDIDFFGDYALVGCLKGPGANEAKYPGAPCYIYHWPTKKVVSVITPKGDFGHENGRHIHNAAWWPQIVDGKVVKLFIAFSYWNPGDFKLVEVTGLPLK